MYEALYKKKLVTADRAACLVPEGGAVIHGMSAGEPPALLRSLEKRLRSGDLKSVCIHAMGQAAHSMATVLAPDLADQVISQTWFVSPLGRKRVRVGLSWYVPNSFHQIPRFIRENMDTDVAMAVVSPMDKSGFFTFGISNDYITTAARHTKKLVVEVNPNMPRVFGDSLLHVSEVDAICENDEPIREAPELDVQPETQAMGRIIAEMVPDGACIQIGWGAIPAAVCRHLQNHRDLGIHTEAFDPSLMELIEKGVVTGRKKNMHVGKHVFTFALGNRKFYDFLHDNPSCESYPVSYTNDPAVIAKNDGMISINATLEVDLLGQCNSEHLSGSQFSGTGGQLDFVRGAYNSKEGKSIIAFCSTAKNGEISRVVPRLDQGAVTTTPRTDTHWLVTEHGAANLKGKSTKDRALAIIALAHPRFRDELLKEAENMYLL